MPRNPISRCISSWMVFNILTASYILFMFQVYLICYWFCMVLCTTFAWFLLAVFLAPPGRSRPARTGDQTAISLLYGYFSWKLFCGSFPLLSRPQYHTELNQNVCLWFFGITSTEVSLPRRSLDLVSNDVAAALCHALCRSVSPYLVRPYSPLSSISSEAFPTIWDAPYRNWGLPHPVCLEQSIEALLLLTQVETDESEY